MKEKESKEGIKKKKENRKRKKEKKKAVHPLLSADCLLSNRVSG